MFQQRRKSPRRNLIYYLEIRDRNTERLVGNLVDITTDGIMMVSEESLETNKIYPLKMILPEVIQSNKEMVFDATCVRTAKDPNTRYYNSGLQFHLLDPVYLPIIDSLVYEFKF
ncbi:MAG: PilZ domain-containing protein [Proteobacteria bacterium]|nr:PilZ domain-containing protein [Pseudomonadota bacterium]